MNDSPPRDLVGIIARSVDTEARLAAALRAAESPATVDDIKKMIFEEDGDHAFTTYLRDMLGVFRNSDALDRVDGIPLIEDAWNYFPHRRLDGRSPAEVFLAERD
jgi:hypothetical protein